MTSHVQGSLKALLLAVAAVGFTMSSFQAAAQARPAGPRGQATRPPIRSTPPVPVVVVDPCKRAGPGITPC
jgi:hypothetical protein